MNSAEVTGRVHSIETCGTVDGPGIRYVLFLQGCSLRCLYCHNPDTWDEQAGRETTVAEALSEIVQYKSYMRFSGGGVTVSGGEPLLQPTFVGELLTACRNEGIHTALDTSGHAPLAVAKPVLDQCDLVLLDIKAFHPDAYRKITGVELSPTLRIAEYLCQRNTPVWVRYVLVPSLTDDEESIRALADYLAPMENVAKVEVIPFHKMGEYKWKELNLTYTLTDIPPAHHRLVEHTKDIFRNRGITVE